MKALLRAKWMMLPVFFMGCASTTLVGPVTLDYTAPPTPKCVNCTDNGLRLGLTFNKNTNNDIVATTKNSNEFGVTSNGQANNPVVPASSDNFNVHEESYSSTLSASYVFHHQSMCYGLAQLSDNGGKAYDFFTFGIGKIFGDEDENFILRTGLSVMQYHLTYHDQVTTYPLFPDEDDDGDGSSNNGAMVEKDSGSVSGGRLLPSLGLSYDALIGNTFYLNLNMDVFHFFDYAPLGIEHTLIPISVYVSPKTAFKVHPIFGVEYSINTLDVSSPSVKFSAGIEI
jgi:hypothetical protein